MTAARNSPGWAETIAIASLLAIHALLCTLGSGPTNDDAFISLRYARNLVEGHGLVFNEGERVEGYTNFLWTLLLAASMRVSDPLLAAKVLGIACSLGALVVVWRGARRADPGLAVAAVAFAALHPALVRWSTRGLETSLFTLLAAGTLVLAASNRSPYAVAAVALLATLTRPEGAVVAVAGALALLSARRRPDAVRFSAAYALSLIPYAAFKLAYYGSLLPNTYYAKSGGGVFQIWRGIAYVTRGFGLPELVLGVAVVVGLLRRPSPPELRAAAVGAALLLGAVVKEGGDSLGPDRFLAPIVPLLAVAAATAAGGLFPRPRTALSLAAVALAALSLPRLPALASVFADPKPYTAAFEETEPGTKLGKCLGKVARLGDSVATSVIGRVPYYSRLYTLDVFGLIDPHIAHLPPSGAAAAGHEKTDPDYILAREPTYVLAGEVVVGPPRERTWVAWLRRAVSGDPPDVRPRMLVPPLPGYEPLMLPCPDGPRRVWRRKATGS